MNPTRIRRYILAVCMATGLVTLDPGFMNTGSCQSSVTFIDGDQGILRYRGYAIEELGTKVYGKNQLIGTEEYSFNLLPLRRWDFGKVALRLGLDLAIFADVGTAWNESREFVASRARGGGGAGLRLLVPGAEMVRPDVGWSRQGGFQFHVAGGA